MPFAGLGLHILLALFCAYHVVRSGQQLYWLFVLFTFPLLGSVIYFFAVYLPNSRLERGAMRAVSAAARALDPTREVREARARLEETPTAQNQMRLAAALLDNEQAGEAARLYEGCLKGPFAADLEIKFGAARAFTECQRFPEAMTHLQEITARDAGFRRDQVALLTARCLAGSSRASEARQAFEGAISAHGTFEAHAEYMIWTLAIGDAATAARLQTELDKISRRWNAMARELNEPFVRRLKAAQQLAQRQS